MKRREPGCSLEEDGLAASANRSGLAGRFPAKAEVDCDRQESARDAVEEVLCSKPARECWLAFAKLVHERYAYSTMYELHVVDGRIVSGQNVQRSFMLVPATPQNAADTPSYDAHWKALEALCASLGTNHLAEVVFYDGRPVRVVANESKKRFKSFLRKAYAQEEALI